MMNYPGKAITDRYPSRMLCGKRYDNGGSFTASSSGTPHTCFEDTVLVPLASWIFYIVLAAVLVSFVVSRGSGDGSRRPLHKLVHRSRDGQKLPKTKTAFSIVYSLLLIATLLMNVLEIARLYLADRGAGLLPFTLASLVILIVLVHTPFAVHRLRAVSLAILTFLLLILVFTAVKLATLSHLQYLEPRSETEYLDSDQIIDVSVIVALYVLELVVEGLRFLRLAKNTSSSNYKV